MARRRRRPKTFQMRLDTIFMSALNLTIQLCEGAKCAFSSWRCY